MRPIRLITAIVAALGRTRTGQSFLGFLAVFAAFSLYTLTVVPFIEPEASFAANTQIEDEKIQRAKNAVRRRLSRFDSLLESCSIRMKDPKILESDQITLLFRSYENNPEDGTVTIKPFLLIHLPDDPDMTEAERIAAATVLEAKNGAILAFDEGFDLSRGKVGKIVGGTLDGEVTIRSKGESAGPEDDLSIVAPNIELTEDAILCRETVAFRYGPHYGTGSQMVIRLRNAPGEDDTHAPKISGIESFSMGRVHELHMQFDNPEYEGDKTQPPHLPIDVRCQGSLTFRTVTRQATFENGVDVLLGRPNGQSDHLSCQMLLIHFADKRETSLSKEEAQRKRKEGDILDLEPYRIEARGTPVRLIAPTYELVAEGEVLDYDFGTGRVLLENRSGDAVLEYQGNRLKAKKLQYQAAEDGRLGEIRAEGPGTLRGLVEGEKEPLSASWGGLLEVRPDLENKDGQLVSLTGGVVLQYSDLGRLESEKIYLWLHEDDTKAGGNVPKLRPDRMLAENRVTLQSDAMFADVGRMEVWFDEVPAEEASKGPVNPLAAAEAAAPATAGNGWRHSGPETAAAASPPEMMPVNPRRAMPYYTPPEDKTPKRRFHVEGEVLQVNLRIHPERMSVARLVLEGNVRLREMQTAPGEAPVLVEGYRVSVVDADAPHACVAVVGTQERPAHFEGGGLSLRAATINVNRGTNSLWTDDAGMLKARIDRDLAGRPIKDAGPLTIEWQTRMSFDGQTARFEGAVTASTRFQHVRTETLDARLRRPVSFSADSAQPDPEPAEILCRGGVVFENHAYDIEGRVSQDVFEVADMKINLLSGDLIANGPANVTTIRRGFSDPTQEGSEKKIIPLQRGEGPKTYLNVRCQGPVSGKLPVNGNLPNGEVSFNEEVKAVYGPVGMWESTLDPNNPDVLDDRGAVLACDRLSIAQMAVPGGEPAFELEATGNTVVEGRTFMARGARVSYSQAKDLLILEGDGRDDAELFRQERLGGPTNRFAQKKIEYSPSSKRLNVAGSRRGRVRTFAGNGPASKDANAEEVGGVSNGAGVSFRYLSSAIRRPACTGFT